MTPPPGEKVIGHRRIDFAVSIRRPVSATTFAQKRTGDALAL
jgi:hypothetical protein